MIQLDIQQFTEIIFNNSTGNYNLFSLYIQEDKLQLNGINMEMKSLCKQPLPIVRFYSHAADEDNEGVKGKELRIEPRLKHAPIRGILYSINKNFNNYIN